MGPGGGQQEHAIKTRSAVLLAAGRGTRVGPLTAATPKCLLRVNGRALLDCQLEALAQAGIDDVTVVAGFMADAVIRHVAGRCRVLVNQQFATTGSIASLALAASHVRGQGFVLQNGDTLYPVDLIRRLISAPHHNTCLVDSAKPYAPGEYHVEIADGRVVRYSNPLPPELSGGQSAQLLRVGPDDSAAFLDAITALVSSGGAKGFPNQAYRVLIDGRGLWPVFTAGIPWWEIDTADDLARCDADGAAMSRTATGIERPLPSLNQSLTASRIVSFVRSPRLPRRLRWLPTTARSMVRHPALVAQKLNDFRCGQLSLPGLDLAVNGRHFLRLTLLEAQALGLQPFLLWGTLLGCVRNSGFIHGDQDIDLGVMENDAARLSGLPQRMKRHGFNVRIRNDHKLSLVHPRHPRLFVDIDVLRPHRDGWAITNRHSDAQKIFHYHFPASVFAGTQTAAFGRRLKVRIPTDAEGFLAAVYGDWRLPSGKVDYRYGPLNTELELVTGRDAEQTVTSARWDHPSQRGAHNEGSSRISAPRMHQN